MSDTLVALREREDTRRQRYVTLLKSLAGGRELTPDEIGEIDALRIALHVQLGDLAKGVNDLHSYFEARRRYTDLMDKRAELEAEKRTAEAEYERVNREQPIGLNTKFTEASARRDAAREQLRAVDAAERAMIATRMKCESLLAAGE